MGNMLVERALPTLRSLQTDSQRSVTSYLLGGPKFGAQRGASLFLPVEKGDANLGVRGQQEQFIGIPAHRSDIVGPVSAVGS